MTRTRPSGVISNPAPEINDELAPSGNLPMRLKSRTPLPAVQPSRGSDGLATDFRRNTRGEIPKQGCLHPHRSAEPSGSLVDRTSIECLIEAGRKPRRIFVIAPRRASGPRWQFRILHSRPESRLPNLRLGDISSRHCGPRTASFIQFVCGSSCQRSEDPAPSADHLPNPHRRQPAPFARVCGRVRDVSLARTRGRGPSAVRQVYVHASVSVTS